MKQRRRKHYFERLPGAPEPVVVEIPRRVRFNEADPMAVLWHGRYPLLFEEAGTNVAQQREFKYGDPDAAFARADRTFQYAYRFPRSIATRGRSTSSLRSL